MFVFPQNLTDTSASVALPDAAVPGFPLIDRRRAQRIRQPMQAEISEWVGQRTGRAFRVTIQDLSTAGVGLTTDEPVQVGRKYLLEVPRPGRPPLAAPFTVVRSDAGSGGLFAARLEPDDVLDVAVRASLERSPAVRQSVRRTLLTASAVFCIAMVVASYFLYVRDAAIAQDAVPVRATVAPVTLR
jgi:hypothetical protein